MPDRLRTQIDGVERGAILRLLTAVGAFEANDSLLLGALASLGHRVGIDRIRAHLDFLAEAGLVRTRAVDAAGSQVAALTDRGLDVATGRATATGVEPPRPSQL